MEQPQVNEYVDLQIIDCNRRHSVQAISGNDTNPAIFTNELGKGITLNVGDRVAVQGAYISEIGAGADTIELNGRSMDTTKTITYIEEDLLPNAPDNYPVSMGQTGISLITDKQLLRSKETTDTFIPKDNETKITCEFYKTAGGDGSYLFLPRRWAWDNASATQSDDKLVKYLSDNWTKNDIKELGRTYYEPIVETTGALAYPGQFVSDDYLYIDTSTTKEASTGFYRLKQDGSRYTLMRATENNFYLRKRLTEPDGTETSPVVPSGEEGSHYKYRIFRQKIDIKVDKGFNSPDNIAQEISAILKKADSPKVYQDILATNKIHELSVFSETPTYKPLLCGSSRTLSKTAWTAFAKRRSNEEVEDDQDFWDYKSNFFNIYCKRPEIREAGQKVNDSGTGYRLHYGILKDDRATAEIITQLPWTENNLNNLRDLFKAQKIYPELFNNHNAQQMQPPSLVGTEIITHSVEDMRYLHMANNNYTTALLGSDGDASLEPGPPQSRQSLPVFIYFDKNNEDILTDGEEGNLCYGFAKKHKHFDGTEKIIFTAEKIGGLQIGLFNFNNVDIGANSRRIGYDWSFGAYGSAYMIAYNGRLETDYGDTQIWGVGSENRILQEDKASDISYPTGQDLRLNYVGSNNPKLRYDSAESRFYFEDLHTPELTGQIAYGAGDTGTIKDIDTPSDNTGAGRDRVYKINKRVTKYTYSPDLRPYDSKFTAKYSYPSPNFNEHNASVYEREISAMNRNIAPWSIIDSPCGIFINDLGYTREQFSNGLWGILGWDYDSLQAPTTSENNRLQRIDNTNKNKLSIPTTNADIVSSDSRDYIINQYGALYFTTQIPTPSLVGGTFISNSTLGRQQFTPAITQAQVSVGLFAPFLPRKMLKPYYCIRSDIIDKPHYLGGVDNEALLPVVAVCDKQYSSTDFIFSSESDYVFTITKKKTITSITTSIHDPNQEFSSVNNDSAVIYKISKNITNRTDISQQIMEESMKKKK